MSMGTVIGCKVMRFVGIIMNDVAAVILVGGKSSRMGQDKATLPYQGKRLVDVVAEVLRQAGIARVYVSGELEGYDSLPDLLAERGPVGGICTSAARLCQRYMRAMFIPVDMPYVSEELLQALILQPTASYFEGHPLPCIVSLDKKTMRQIEAIAQALARNQKLSVKSFLAGLGANAIPVPAHLEKALTNTNTPEEWEEITHESAHQ